MIARLSRARLVLCAVLVLVVCAAVAVTAIGLNLPKATGKTVKKDGKITVDCSNMSEGYIMVKGKKSSKRIKIQVTSSKSERPLNYDLNSNGEY